MTRYRVRQRDYMATAAKSHISDELRQTFEEMNQKERENRDMIAQAKKLGCKQQFDDCPKEINGRDCYSCPMFPKKYQVDPKIYKVK